MMLGPRGGGVPLLRALLLLSLAMIPAQALRAGTAAGEAGAALHGKVTRETEPVAGARVCAYLSIADVPGSPAAAVSAPTGVDGLFRLELAPGTYHLVARRQEGAPEGPVPVGGFFSYHGSNPFTLMPGSATEVNFSLARKTAAGAVGPGADPASGTIAGIVTWDGRQVEGAQVKLFLDAESAFRGSGYAAAPPTDASGAFAFDLLPESAYYVVARRRRAGVGPGPIAEGDLYGYHVDNPVAVRAGSAVRIEIELVSKGRETGTADGRPRPSGTRITGRITDTAGAVVPGVYAFAYEEKVMAHRKPAYISQPADAQGRYVINLGAGGTFYVGARSAYGDSPGRGEWYGRYDGTPDHGVTVAAGASAEGIDIRVERVLP